MKKLLTLVALLAPISTFALDLINDFEWLEPNNKVEVVVGEPYQLKFNCSNNSLAFTSAYSDSWVHVDFEGGQHVVNPPTGYSIDEKGVITGLIPGSYAVHPTGWVQRKSGAEKWLYIKVVSERLEKESNNTLDTANDVFNKIRFGLYNISDVDYFKYTNSNLKWGDYVTFRIHYFGSRESPFGYKWATFSGTEMVGGGSLISQNQECKALVAYGKTVYLEVYYDQSRSEYFNYKEEFVAEVFINGVPANEYGNDSKAGFEGEGTENSPYLIKTPSNLKELAKLVNAGNSYANTYFELSDNVDMTGEIFEPIGNQNCPFSGNFNGKGFVIKGISVNADSNLGLFGYIENADINDVGIEEADIRGGSNIGGIAGYSQHSIITNCFTRGSTFGNDCVGALVGYSSEGTIIRNCFSSMQHTKYEIYGSVGGLVGYNCGKMENCYFYGTINAKIFEKSTTGGIVGYNHTTGSIHYCYFIKYGDVMNGELNYCGSLNWGDCFGTDSFDLYGITTSGKKLYVQLNTWVSDHNNEGGFRKWTNDSFPSFGDYAEPTEIQNMINGHEYVDLGLPSGRLWAKTNYGASTEREYGAYVEWSARNIVQSVWGEEWSTPTQNDIIELCNQCTLSWGYSNSVYGCFVTGVNGNSIFLPAAGFKIMGSSQMEGHSIYYWSNAEYESGFAGSLSGSSDNGVNTYSTYNYSLTTMPIRPVATKKGNNPETGDEIHEYVDLALPSGNLWAKTNVGAKNQSDFGTRYAYGETTEKSTYMEDSYIWLNQTTGEYTKYTISGFIPDNRTELESEDDAATQNWGEQWHTPTPNDFIELCNYCISTWEVINGVSGRKFTGANGNSIFLPAAGFVYWYNEYSNELGYYMTNQIESNERFILFYFDADSWSTSWRNVKYQGYSVRPVTNIDSNGINNVTLNSTNEIERIFDLQGKRLQQVKKGLNIIRTKDGKTKKVVMK
ncbi:MAG: hypothetical protein J5658_02080 [Prevotella sp.]|nr:hypothetical protein [Prevotella sp.]